MGLVVGVGDLSPLFYWTATYIGLLAASMGMSEESQVASNLLVSNAFPKLDMQQSGKRCIAGVKNFYCIWQAAGPPQALVIPLLPAQRRQIVVWLYCLCL